jgi:hypothetical protein
VELELRDYQREAALGVLGRLARAGDGWRQHQSRSSFALSAITGSGKTVIATAVIEALIYGSADLGCDPDPRATFLWVTDDPALNRQTRNKMLEASELLQPARLIELDNDFLDSELSPGRVYFLNVQKLSKNAGLNHGGNNLRQHSMWEVLANTVTADRADLVLVLDEAHKGMKRIADRKTIVRQIIDGRAGVSPPVPTVWGISATIDRFKDAMVDTAERDALSNIEVDTAKVRASGLLKDEIGLDDPDESGTFSTTMLREAIKDALDYERRWADYAEKQNEPLVLPVLVVQVPDKASDAKLADTLAVIDSEWVGLGPDAMVHVFGEHEPLVLGGRKVRWVPPESIQGDTDVRVVLAKTAISTGWDCPRAEVLYSERPAKDATHIAQIIGRMVRAPLARRVTTDDALNSVSCYLPLFDRGGLTAIKAELEGHGKDRDDEQGPEIIRAPKIFERNTHLDPEVFDAVEALLSLPPPDVFASPLRRAKKLATLLADTPDGKPALVADAGAELSDALNARLDGFAAEHKATIADRVADLNTTDIRRTITDTTGTEKATSTRSVATHVADLKRDTQRIIRSVKEGVGTDFLEHRVRAAAEGDDLFDIRIDAAAVLSTDGATATLDTRATEWVIGHLAAHAAAIRNTTGATRDAYRRVQEQTTTPEAVNVELRANEKAATKDGKGNDLPTHEGHLFADPDGKYPAALNGWETTVLDTEVARDSFVAWYRNPSRPTPSAVRIAYQDDAETWRSLQVDFVILSRRDDGTLGVSLIDPHGTHLADGRAKLRALADYAERFGDTFVRIDALAEIDGVLRCLDMLEPAVRTAVDAYEGSDLTALYASAVARDYL